MARSITRFLRLQTVIRALLTLLFVALWFSSLSGEFAMGRRWQWSTTYPAPLHPTITLHADHYGELSIRSAGGAANLVWGSTTEDWGRVVAPPPVSNSWFYKWSQRQSSLLLAFFGLGGCKLEDAVAFTKSPRSYSPNYVIIPIPYLLLAMLAATPFRMIWRKMQSSSRSLGTHCLQCAYDLRAHQPGQRCPECGYEIPRHTTAPIATANIHAQIN